MAEYPKIFEKVSNEILELYSNLELSRAIYGGVKDPKPSFFLKEEEKKQAMIRMVREALLFLDLQCEKPLCRGNHKVRMIPLKIKYKIF